MKKQKKLLTSGKAFDILLGRLFAVQSIDIKWNVANKGEKGDKPGRLQAPPGNFRQKMIHTAQCIVF